MIFFFFFMYMVKCELHISSTSDVCGLYMFLYTLFDLYLSPPVLSACNPPTQRMGNVLVITFYNSRASVDCGGHTDTFCFLS